MSIGLPVRESKGGKSSSSIEDVLSLSGESSPTGLSLLEFVRRGELGSSSDESPSWPTIHHSISHNGGVPFRPIVTCIGPLGNSTLT